MIVNVERTAAEQAASVAKALVETARRGGTEADFRREAARILEDAGLSAGFGSLGASFARGSRLQPNMPAERLLIPANRSMLLMLFIFHAHTSRKGVYPASPFEAITIACIANMLAQEL